MRLGLLLPLLCLCFGCSRPPEVPLTVSESQKKIEEKCREEFDMHVMTRRADNTFWIYLPVQEPIFDYEAQKETPAGGGEERKQAKFALQYVDAAFKDRQFTLEYDVITRKKSLQEDYGFNSSYTDSYVKKQNNLFTAVSDVFFNTKAAAGEKLPEFFVLVITDIKKGMETRSTFYLQDFKRYMTGDLPYDEYMKRFLADTKGGQGMIGDETGTHLDYKPVVMTEFLSKQMANRVRFKFQHSDFPPPDEYDTTVAGIAADTARYYDFTDFKGVELRNLRQDKKFFFDKAKLTTLGDDAPFANTGKPPKGKLIHIRFDNGETKIEEEPPSAETNSASTQPAK